MNNTVAALSIMVTQRTAAARYGRLVAQGLLTLEECVPPLMEAAIRAGYRGARHGLQARLTWAVSDSAAAWRLRRGQAEREIRRAIGPLVLRYAPSDTILAQAGVVNEQYGGALLDSEVRAIAEEEVANRLRVAGRRAHAR